MDIQAAERVAATGRTSCPMKLDKTISIEIVDEAKEAYERLNKIVGQQKASGRTTSDEIKLWNGIQRAFGLIRQNPFYGENAKKSLIPAYYRQRYKATNLFIVDLPLFWRMIYTLESSKIDIVAFVLDIFTHRDYDKRFGFRKK